MAEATAGRATRRAPHRPRQIAISLLSLGSALIHIRCDDPYPIAPTACDDYCLATQRAGCEEDYPEGCVSDCENRALARRWPRCEQLWLTLTECYRGEPDSAFLCVEEESRPLPVCIDERVALAACMSPVRGICMRECLREALECGEPERRCEGRCRGTPPGCDERARALYECQLNNPVDCVDPQLDTRSPSEISCLAEIGAVLECAMQ